MTTTWSMISMTVTTSGYSVVPASVACSSSMVERTKVKVDTTTMKRLMKAMIWANLLVHGYSNVFQVQDLHCNTQHT